MSVRRTAMGHQVTVRARTRRGQTPNPFPSQWPGGVRSGSARRLPGIERERADLTEAEPGVDASIYLRSVQDADAVAQLPGAAQGRERDRRADTLAPCVLGRRDLIDAPDARPGEAIPEGRLTARCDDVRGEGALTVRVAEEPSLTVGSPADVTLLPGDTRTIEVRVRRRLCEGAVQVRLVGLPAAVTARPVTVPADKDVASVELTAAANGA